MRLDRLRIKIKRASAHTRLDMPAKLAVRAGEVPAYQWPAANHFRPSRNHCGNQI
jgi:hypothetical protein